MIKSASTGATSTSLLSRILALAAPTSLVALLQIIAQLAETWIAARQGTAALAGWAVVLPFALLLQQMSTGAMGGGVVSAIARSLGAGRTQDASALVLHALLIATAAGALFAVVLAGFPRPVLGAIGGTTAADAAAAYAVWLFGAGAIPAWVANTLASVLRGGGRHALAARVLTLAWAVLPVLAWFLAEPMRLGLTGLGVAYALVNWTAAIAMIVVVLRGGAGFTPNLRIGRRQPSSGVSSPSAWLPRCWPPSPTSRPSLSPPAWPNTAPPRWLPTASRRDWNS